MDEREKKDEYWQRQLTIIYWFLFAWTAAYVGLCIAVFIGHGVFATIWQVAPGMEWSYVTLLSFYVAVKEVRRLKAGHVARRHGEIFIYIWWFVLLAMYITISVQGKHFELPRGMDDLCKGVLAIYAVSLGVKAYAPFERHQP